MPFPVPLQIPPGDFGKVKGVKIMREMNAILTISLLIPKFYGEGGVLMEDTCCSIVGWEQSDPTDVFWCLLYS